MHGFLKQSTAAQSRAVGPFVDDTDFKTLETGLSIANTDVKLVKNGAASVNKNSGGGTHRINGVYSLTFDATDTDTVGELNGSIAATGALVVLFKFTVLEEAVYDAMFGSSAPGYLQPTVAARTLDITATGAAGIDWANVEGQGTSVNLSSTTTNLVNTATTVSGSVGSVTGAVGSVTAGVTIASGGIIVGAFATDSITADALATSAVDEIRDGLLPTQNVAFSDISFNFVTATDPATPVTGATGTGVTRSIDGGSFGAGTGTLSEVSNGAYVYDASAADMNGGKIQFRFTATGGTPSAPRDTFVTIVTGGGV